jgi:hypothetical protein
LVRGQHGIQVIDDSHTSPFTWFRRRPAHWAGKLVLTWCWLPFRRRPALAARLAPDIGELSAEAV